jgi:hypothetical protein
VIAAIAAADVLAVAGLFALTLAVQPRRVWRDAAEHSRAFWLGWVLVAIGIGVAGALRVGPGWPGTAWLAACVAFGCGQPPLLADLLDTRRHVRRCRTAAVRPAPAAGPLVEPICWHAPPALTIAVPSRAPARAVERLSA